MSLAIARARSLSPYLLTQQKTPHPPTGRGDFLFWFSKKVARQLFALGGLLGGLLLGYFLGGLLLCYLLFGNLLRCFFLSGHNTHLLLNLYFLFAVYVHTILKI